MFAVSKELLQRLKSAACQLFLEIHVALIARDQLPEDFANTAVPTRELDHPIRERCSPEISIETTAHLRSALQLAAKILAPQLFVIERLARKVRLRKYLT